MMAKRACFGMWVAAAACLIVLSANRAWAQGATPLLSEGKPSQTAQATANLCAAYQLLDRPPSRHSGLEARSPPGDGHRPRDGAEHATDVPGQRAGGRNPEAL